MTPFCFAPRLPRFSSWLALLLSCAATAGAQPAYRVIDIATLTTPGAIAIPGLTPFDSAVYFGARNAASGEQLWKSDGTPQGTSKLLDFDPLGYSTPAELTPFGSRLLFFVSGELLSTDGTVAGMSLVKAFGPNASPVATAVAGTNLYFSIDDGEHGVELWKSDGTPAGTSLVSDIEPGPAGSTPSWLTPLDDTVYFFASDAAGSSLWRAGGSVDGAVRVAVLPTLQRVTSQDGVAASGGLLFFITGDGSDSLLPYHLWRSDGTAAGTFALRDFAASFGSVCPGHCYPYGPSDLTALGNQVLLIANDGIHGRELWKSNGTTAGTVLVKDVFPGPDDGLYSGMRRAGGLVYFTGEDPEHGYELWKTDGTAAGTEILVDIESGPDSSYAFSVGAHGDRVFFATGSPGVQLWVSDGTEAGTRFLLDVGGAASGSYPYAFADLGESSLFLTWAGIGSRLWKTDGTPEGTEIVENFVTGTGSYPARMFDFLGRLTFSVADPDEGAQFEYRRLWVSDGSEDGTRPIADFERFRPAGLDGIGDVSVFGDSLFFAASDATHGIELWKSDGTPEGASLVRDIAIPTPERLWGVDSYPSVLTVLGDTLFFAAEDADHGLELWRTDGTPEGTAIVRDIRPGWGGSYLSYGASPVVLAGRLYFYADDGVHGAELWRSDGTSGGTVLVRDIHAGPDGSPVSRLVASGEQIFFAAYDGTAYALWKTDGTAGGTLPVRAFDLLFAYDLTAAGGLVYFTNPDQTELWISDGTAAGTRSIASVRASNLTAVGDALFFTGDDGIHGPELWKSDGTEGGTGLVRDIREGPAGSVAMWTPPTLLAVDGRVVFAGSDEEHGTEVWVSDGTEAGTVMLDDIAPGKPSSSPSSFTRSGDRIFFTADDGVTGVELWAMPAHADPARTRILTPLVPTPREPRVLPRP